MLLTLEDIKLELGEIEQNIINSFTIMEEVDLEEYPGCTKVAELEVQINGKPAVLTVGFTGKFPNELPNFYDKKNLFGIIPHKMPNGFLCFTRNESLILDIRHPCSILLQCLIKVIKLIEDGVNGINHKEFLDEFEVYWRNNPSLNIYAHIDTTNSKLRELDLWSNIAENDDLFITVAAEKRESLEKVISRIFHIDIDKATKYRCLYIPLKEGTFLLPPINEEKWDFGYLKNNIFSNLSEENRKEFYRLVKKQIKDVRSNLEFIVIGLPTPKGNIALFGYFMEGGVFNLKSRNNKLKRQLHPFVLKPKNMTLYRSNIERWHPNHLLNRTGGNTELIDKHILIVGVGSIGSEIAMRFAKAGVKKISLVDFDKLELDNVHRHALGGDQVYDINKKLGLYNKPKVWGIEEEIKRKYPFTEVKTYYDDIFSIFENIGIIKSNIDLFIVAIGSPNKEMMINERLHKLPEPPPTIYTWVEPLGIGGHTLVTLNNERKGCYQCLFKPDEESPIYNRSAFAEPLQDFSKSITGCGSVFTPYSFLDSERSAMLAVEAGIKVLMGNMKGNPLLSWKGENDLFEKYGYNTTIRYRFTTEKIDGTKYAYRDERCPICSEEGRDIHQ